MTGGDREGVTSPVEGLVGSGTSASVYIEASTEPGGQRHRAVKTPHPHLAAIPSFAEAFCREAELASRLDHPNIIRIYETGTRDGSPYVLMEYVPGETLRQHMDAQGPLAFGEALDFTVQILRALDHAHQHGVIHCDVKPQNLLLGPDGVLKVTDFGLARATTPSSLSLSTTWRGTPYYLAPEVVASGQPDTRSDLYAVGCILYEMLTGKVPFAGEHPWEVIRRHQTEEPPAVRTLRRDVPADVEAVLRRAMAKDPRGRYATAAAMLADVERVRAGVGLPRAQRAGYELIRHLLRWKLAYQQRQRRLGMLAVASAVAALMGLAVYGAVWALPQTESWWLGVRGRIEEVLAGEGTKPPTPTLAANAVDTPQPLPPARIDPAFYYAMATEALGRGDYASAAGRLSAILRQEAAWEDAQQRLREAKRALALQLRESAARDGWPVVNYENAFWEDAGQWSGPPPLVLAGEAAWRDIAGEAYDRSMALGPTGSLSIRFIPELLEPPTEGVRFVLGKPDEQGQVSAVFSLLLSPNGLTLEGTDVDAAINELPPTVDWGDSNLLVLRVHANQLEVLLNGQKLQTIQGIVPAAPLFWGTGRSRGAGLRLQHVVMASLPPTPTPTATATSTPTATPTPPTPTPTATPTSTPTPTPSPAPPGAQRLRISFNWIQLIDHVGGEGPAQVFVEMRATARFADGPVWEPPIRFPETGTVPLTRGELRRIDGATWQIAKSPDDTLLVRVEVFQMINGAAIKLGCACLGYFLPEVKANPAGIAVPRADTGRFVAEWNIVTN